MKETEQPQQPLLLITGSSGLIGTKLTESLSDSFRIVGLDNVPPQETPVESRWIECDLTDDASVSSALDEVRAESDGEIASVLHLAAYYDFSGEPSPLYQELTVEGTRRLLRGLQSFQVEQFIFSSTLLVMESADDDRPVTASSLVDAEWDYPQSKLAAEKAIKQERGEIPALILRLAGVYDEDCHSLPVAQQIARIYEKQLESHLFPGDKEHGQSFIHLDDLVACYRAAIEKRKKLSHHEVFVIGEEDVMSYGELQEALGQLIHDKDWTTIRIPKFVAKAGAWVKDKFSSDETFIKPWMISLADQNYPVNIHRARRELGWQPEHTLRETLPEMIRRLHADPRSWYEHNGLPLPDELEEPEPSQAAKS